MDRSALLVVALSSAAMALAGCSGDEVEDDGIVGFHAEVEQILRDNCQDCHHDAGIAPFALVTYDQARALAPAIAEVTANGTMPPWGARDTNECSPRFGWKNDARLSDKEIATLAEWATNGAPIGEEAPLDDFEAPAFGLENPSLEITQRNAFTTSGDQDEFVCFVMDPGITELEWVTGMNVIPGNPKVVHHAGVLWDPTAASEALADADGKFACGGGATAMIPTGRLLQVWVPGSMPFELPREVAVPIEPGGRIVMQIHYHPGGVMNDPDLTTVQLRYSQQIPEYFIAPAAPIGNYPVTLDNGDGLQPGPNDPATGPAFIVPADVSDHEENMVATVPAVGLDGNPIPPLWIYGAAAHMHLVGVDLKVTLDRANPQGGEPASECLIHEPAWDFNWQRFYSYDTELENLPSLRPGDKIRVRCRYDNTMDNPAVQGALLERGLPAPVDVVLGEQTLDEMCLTMLPVLAKIP
jgi:mono/diheme cytochrome c family protein